MSTATLNADFQIDADFAASMNCLSPEEASQLEANLLKEGCRDALVVWREENLLLDGHNRFDLCQKHGLPYETHYISLPDRQTALEWICENQLGRRNLTPFQKAELALKFKSVLAEKAKERQLAGLKKGDKVPVLQNSAERETTEVREELAAKAGVSRDTIDRAEFLSKHADDETKQKLRTGETTINKEYTRLKPHVAHNSGNNEWYTPEDYIERARRAMGNIDLDPASCDDANEIVRAARFLSRQENGLEQEWSGNVWMNPPYEQPFIQQFCDKLVESYRNGSIQQAIVLVNNATETRWGQTLLSNATAVCFPAGRVKFWNPEKIATPLQGQMVLYFGPCMENFSNEFGDLGVVCHGN